MTTQAFDHAQVLKNWTELERRIEVGAYEERSAEHYETDTWPDDGVEEGLFNLEKLAAKEGLGFVWDKDTQQWSLEPLSPEEIEAFKSVDAYQEDTDHYIEHHYLGGE